MVCEWKGLYKKSGHVLHWGSVGTEECKKFKYGLGGARFAWADESQGRGGGGRGGGRNGGQKPGAGATTSVRAGRHGGERLGRGKKKRVINPNRVQRTEYFEMEKKAGDRGGGGT